MKVYQLILGSAIIGGLIVHAIDNKEINTLRQDNEFLLNAYCEMENKYLSKLDPDSFEYRLQVGECDENGESFDSLEGLENE